MSFRSPQIIVRFSPGQYIDGNWVEGVETPILIQASVQPLGGNDIKMLTLPQGRVMTDVMRIYTGEELVTVADKGVNQQPDKLIWRGTAYELSSKFVWQSGVIPHYKYFATKVQLEENANT